MTVKPSDWTGENRDRGPESALKLGMSIAETGNGVNTSDGSELQWILSRQSVLYSAL